MEPRRTPTALVVGAGIGGVAASVALQQAGWNVRLFEQAESPRTVGFALGLAPNAISALRALGVGDAIARDAVTPRRAEVRRPDGRVLRRFTADPQQFADAVVPRLILRSALHAALLGAATPVEVETRRTAAAFADDGLQVSLTFADGTTAAGDIVVGADGAGSGVRRQLHPQELPPQPGGYVAVRGLCRDVRLLNGLQALWYLGPGVESGLVQASATDIYWFISLLTADVAGEALEATRVLERFTRGFDAQFRAITGATAPADRRVDELVVRRPLARWGRGRVTLLGDAAHPMLPHTGQGAAQALEDAVALGRAARATRDPVRALRAYEAARVPAARKVVNAGPRIARITTTRNPIVALMRDTAIRVVPSGLLVRAFAPRGDNREESQ